MTLWPNVAQWWPGCNATRVMFNDVRWTDYFARKNLITCSSHWFFNAIKETALRYYNFSFSILKLSRKHDTLSHALLTHCRRWANIKFTLSQRLLLGRGPGAVVKAACLENRRLRAQTALWPSSFKETKCFFPAHSWWFNIVRNLRDER